MTIRTNATAFAVAALMLALVGCGGDSADSASTDPGDVDFTDQLAVAEAFSQAYHVERDCDAAVAFMTEGGASGLLSAQCYDDDFNPLVTSLGDSEEMNFRNPYGDETFVEGDLMGEDGLKVSESHFAMVEEDGKWLVTKITGEF